MIYSHRQKFESTIKTKFLSLWPCNSIFTYLCLRVKECSPQHYLNYRLQTNLTYLLRQFARKFKSHMKHIFYWVLSRNWNTQSTGYQHRFTLRVTFYTIHGIWYNPNKNKYTKKLETLSYTPTTGKKQIGKVYQRHSIDYFREMGAHTGIEDKGHRNFKLKSNFFFWKCKQKLELCISCATKIEIKGSGEYLHKWILMVLN